MAFPIGIATERERGRAHLDKPHEATHKPEATRQRARAREPSERAARCFPVRPRTKARGQWTHRHVRLTDSGGRLYMPGRHIRANTHPHDFTPSVWFFIFFLLKNKKKQRKADFFIIFVCVFKKFFLLPGFLSRIIEYQSSGRWIYAERRIFDNEEKNIELGFGVTFFLWRCSNSGVDRGGHSYWHAGIFFLANRSSDAPYEKDLWLDWVDNFFFFIMRFTCRIYCSIDYLLGWWGIWKSVPWSRAADDCVSFSSNLCR